MDADLARELAVGGSTRILLVVVDGLGGAPADGGATALEAARTPHLDDFARRGISGLHEPAGPGVSVGSGPGHLALFGYDPLRYRVGRGVLSALGIGYPLEDHDVAARGNFASVNDQGVVVDRRAGRISSERNEELCSRLRQIDLPDVEFEVRTVKEHRLLFVLRGEGLGEEVTDTDPHTTGMPPARASARARLAERTADLVRKWSDWAREVLRDEEDANAVLLRGFSRRPHWPSFRELFRLRGVAAAGYPMYRGVSRLIGIAVREIEDDPGAKLAELRTAWDDADFFFLHEKHPDSAGEDGDFDRKVELLEAFDDRWPEIESLGADVVVITGDHSTPAALKSHSWHPVPVALRGSHCRPDLVTRFGESAMLSGALGPRFPTAELLPLPMANAGRLRRFGA